MFGGATWVKKYLTWETNVRQTRHCSLNLYDSILISLCLFLFTAHGDQLVYSFIVPVSCKKTLDAQYVNVTFENDLKQRRSARTDIPVIYGMLLF